MDDRLKATIASLDEDRAGKAFGGSLSSDDPNKFFSDVLKYSFAVLPLLRPGYLKEVPKQGFAEGGSVDDALHVARQAAQQGGGLWDLLKRSAGEMAEMVEPGSTTRETPSVREVAEGMLPRDPYEVVGEAQKKFKEGDKIGAFEEMLGGIPETGAIRAYHGSPHLFDKFDISKIGTGEGAQAYGHGLYFSDNENVARSYREGLSGMDSKIVPKDAWSDMGKVRDFAQKHYKDKPEDQNALVLLANAFYNGADANRAIEFSLPHAKRFGTTPESIARVANEVYNPGAMYETLLHVDPEHLLDWDRPLSEQSPIVQKTITTLAKTAPEPKKGPSIRNRQAILNNDGSVPGDILYNNIGGHNFPAETSSALREAGIPGIKYLDAGSRATGEGSHNYVMFSHDPIEIVRRYNQGGQVLEDDYPSQYLPGVGRQVMADGGGLEGARFAAVDPSMLVGRSTEPYRGGATYTDVGGQKVAAPFVTGMEGGYPVFDLGEKPKPDVPSLPAGKNPFEDWLQFSFLSKLMGRAEGGAVEGDVQFAPPDVEQALKAAREVADQPRPFTESAPKKEYEPFGVLPLKETEEGISFDPYAGLLGSITRPAKYFYETMTGQKEMEPTSEEAIRSATDLAGALTTGAFGATKPAGALTMGAARPVSEKAAEDALMVLHNLKSHRLGMIEKLGGLPVPSIAITKPEQGFTSFGDITLVGSPEMAKPGRTNPVFASDVYSPRFPSIDEDTGKIFRGFTPSGLRRYAPVTMANVVREMKGNIRGGEGGAGLYGAGQLRSSVTPQFKSLPQIQSSRGRIIPKEEFRPFAEQANEELLDLASKFYPYSKYSGDEWTHSGSLIETLSDVAKGRHGAWSQDYKDLPPELKIEAIDFLNYLRDMPTEYFEAKPQRAVGFQEFSGAIIPHDIEGSQADILRNLGVKNLEEYERGNVASQIEALRKFKNLGFEQGGAVENEESIVNTALEVLSDYSK